jgi:hypothetical protein
MTISNTLKICLAFLLKLGSVSIEKEIRERIISD